MQWTQYWDLGYFLKGVGGLGIKEPCWIFFWVGMQTQLFNKQRMIQMASAELQTCVIVLVIEAIG